MDIRHRAWAVLMGGAGEDGPRAPVAHVFLTYRLWREDATWLAECIDLGVPSCGATIDDAFDGALDATIAYLNTLEATGDREAVFAERNVPIGEGAPSADFSVSIPSRQEIDGYYRSGPVGLLVSGG